MTDDTVEVEEPQGSPEPTLPDDPTAAIEQLMAEVEQMRRAEAERVEDLQRLAAEFDNFRKRVVRERQDIADFASQRLVEAMLPVLDSFDGAFTHEPQTPAEEQLLSGFRSTYQQLIDVLGREGLEVVPAVGEAFDPAIHEAVSGVTGDHLVVAEEMRRGYSLRGRVIRPALVAVEHDEEEAGE